MHYNFDEIELRRGTHSIKWDSAKNDETLPMWIADMDFRTFPAVVEALSRVTAKGHFGYNSVPDEFYNAIILWWQKRHDFTIQKDWILPSTGVIAGISATLSALVQPGDEIILQAPTYNHFFNVINASRCTTVVNHLIYEGGTYRIDFEDLELKATSEKAKVLLFCNPHNPVGKMWKEQDLERIAAICARHNVLVLSDEIHSDLVFSGKHHMPFISAAIKCDVASVSFSSASKTFNLSGLHGGYIFVNDPVLRRKIRKQQWAQASSTPGLIACEALIVAYAQGEEWLKELNNYLYDNYLFVRDFVAEHLINITVVPLEATYLVWLDCKKVGIESARLADLLLEKENLWLNAGDIYGTSGEGFLRLNIACPRGLLKEGLARLKHLLGDAVPIRPVGAEV